MMRDTPKVSIVCAFLNGAAFIAETVESVLAQTVQDFELILVDDGSTDPSREMAKAWAAERPGQVRYLEHPGHQNRGLSASRNLGIAAATGHYVAFVDADDVWTPTKLAEQLAILEAHPEAAMVCGVVCYWNSWRGGEDRIVPSGCNIDQVTLPPDALLQLYPLGKAAAPCPSDLLVKRSVVDMLGGFESHFEGPLQLYEDQGFLAKLYLQAPVIFSSTQTLYYRQHPHSIVAEVTRSGKYRQVRGYFLAWLDQYVTGREQTPEVVRRALRRALRPYRHPRIYGLIDLPRRTARSLRDRLRSTRQQASATR